MTLGTEKGRGAMRFSPGTDRESGAKGKSRHRTPNFHFLATSTY